MSPQSHQRLEQLRKTLQDMAHHVAKNLTSACAALQSLNMRHACSVIAEDDCIDHMENSLQKQCQDILTLEQPVAGDLRFVMSTLRITTDLERIADLAVNIAQQISFLKSDYSHTEPAKILLRQMEGVQRMIQAVVGLIAHMDTETAKDIAAMDDLIDQMHTNMFQVIEQTLMEHPDAVAPMIAYLKIAKEFERTADHIVSICEEVVFILEGKSVRHSPGL